MEHKIYRVVSFEQVRPFTLKVTFDDGSMQTIDFRPVLAGELYRPLQDEKFFNQVEIDPEVHTLVWPNGADFDPATLHDWPEHIDEMKKMIERQGKVNAQKFRSYDFCPNFLRDDLPAVNVVTTQVWEQGNRVEVSRSEGAGTEGVNIGPSTRSARCVYNDTQIFFALRDVVHGRCSKTCDPAH